MGHNPFATRYSRLMRNVVLVSVFIIILYFLCSPVLPSSPKRVGTSSIQKVFEYTEDNLEQGGLEYLIKQIYNPLIPSFTESWADADGNSFIVERTLSPQWTTPLKSDVVIIDVDNRIGKTTAVGKAKALDFDHVDHISAAILNHYLYATIHGYDYKVIKPEYDIEMHPTWYKVAGIKEALKNHRFVVFLDGDALFRHLELPVEWLLNYWTLEEHVALAGGYVPNNAAHPGDKNWDKEKKYPKINTGFLIVQQTEVTADLLEAWLDCPDGNLYPSCEKYRDEFPHEQGALADFIRLDQRFEGHIRGLPCSEADGGPENPFCKGTLIEHLWDVLSPTKGEMLFKERVPEYVSRQLARGFFARLYSVFWDKRKDLMAMLKQPPS